MPPVSRLCEPIEGTSMAVLAEKMGLDASKFTSHVSGRKIKRNETLREKERQYKRNCQQSVRPPKYHFIV